MALERYNDRFKAICNCVYLLTFYLPSFNLKYIWYPPVCRRLKQAKQVRLNNDRYKKMLELVTKMIRQNLGRDGVKEDLKN